MAYPCLKDRKPNLDRSIEYDHFNTQNPRLILTLSSEYIQFTVLNLLYDKFKSRQNAWTIVNELLDNDELNYLNKNDVATEIDYLAEEKILTGGSMHLSLKLKLMAQDCVLFGLF